MLRWVWFGLTPVALQTSNISISPASHPANPDGRTLSVSFAAGRLSKHNQSKHAFIVVFAGLGEMPSGSHPQGGGNSDLISIQTLSGEMERALGA
ncbi:unnamed protein product [Clonostachys rosea]|uniref:Uncharacterized protein n=1 Tax=Bionectria ochroleuca TaxID=29856 RepID=A0ABY6U9K3_BIOOC|nr:unnamed protein product [Clonostachys rosea]